MSVTSGGSILITATDFQFTHPRTGKRVAIEIRSDSQVVIGLEFKDGAWQWSRMLYEFDVGLQINGQRATAADELAAQGGAVGWVKNVLVPLINEWFTDMFPVIVPGPAPAPAPIPSGDVWQQLDAAILGLTSKVVVKTDGTVKVVV